MEKGHFMALAAFHEFMKSTMSSSPDTYRPFTLTLVGMTEDYMSQQIRIGWCNSARRAIEGPAGRSSPRGARDHSRLQRRHLLFVQRGLTALRRRGHAVRARRAAERRRGHGGATRRRRERLCHRRHGCQAVRRCARPGPGQEDDVGFAASADGTSIAGTRLAACSSRPTSMRWSRRGTRRQRDDRRPDRRRRGATTAAASTATVTVGIPDVQPSGLAPRGDRERRRADVSGLAADRQRQRVDRRDRGGRRIVSDARISTSEPPRTSG